MKRRLRERLVRDNHEQTEPEPSEVIRVSLAGECTVRTCDALLAVCDTLNPRSASGALPVACRSSTRLFSTGGRVRGADDTVDRGGIESHRTKIGRKSPRSREPDLAGAKRDQPARSAHARSRARET